MRQRGLENFLQFFFFCTTSTEMEKNVYMFVRGLRTPKRLLNMYLYFLLLKDLPQVNSGWYNELKGDNV